MYSVSDEYIEALRRPVKYDRITGQIRLADGTRIEINNNVIVQGKLSITRSVCGSSFDIGTFNAARMSITIKDEAAYDYEFGNATIALDYGLLTDIESDMWEDVPLGVFYVDGHYTTRSGSTVSLQAFDSAGKFEVELPKLDGVKTLYGALQQACLKANVGLAITETGFNAFPNAAVVPDFTRARIQSCRDIVIWVAQAVGASAFIDRDNMLMLKQYYYDGGDAYDRLFTANERSKIKFTDTRTYFAYLSNYCAGEPKMYSNILSFTGADAPHVKEVGLTLPENPLLLALTAEQQDATNTALMKNYSAPTRYIKATGTTDPAIDPLDVVAFKDGSIDIGQIISVCTKIQWKYRGSGYIECNNFDEYSVDNSASAAALADTETQIDTNYARTPPKSQTQKEIDELKAGQGGAAEILHTSGTKTDVITVGTEKRSGLRVINQTTGYYAALNVDGAGPGSTFDLLSADGWFRVLGSGAFGQESLHVANGYARIDCSVVNGINISGLSQNLSNRFESIVNSQGILSHVVVNGETIYETSARNGKIKISLPSGTRLEIADGESAVINLCGSDGAEIAKLVLKSDGLTINGKKVLTEE